MVIPIDIHRGRDTSTANNEFIGAQTQIPGKPVRGKIQVDRESEFRMRNAEFASRHSRQRAPFPELSPRVAPIKVGDVASFSACLYLVGWDEYGNCVRFLGMIIYRLLLEREFYILDNNCTVCIYTIPLKQG